MESRLKSRSKGATGLLEKVENLHDNIKELKRLGMKTAMFCHVEVLLQM